jgi:pimeloyl-ACP methyl ester carboxylesterase
MAGAGSPLILIHGVTASSETLRAVWDGLAERHTLISPDLLGHGQSVKPRGDYSMGAFASGVRDLVASLEIGPLLAGAWTLSVGRALGRALDVVGIPLGTDLLEMARGMPRSGTPRRARTSFTRCAPASISVVSGCRRSIACTWRPSCRC